MRAPNRWLIQPGRSDVPSSRVNTRPESVQADPHASRSASWALRQTRRTLTVPGSIGTWRSDSAFGGVELVVDLGLADIDAAAVEVKVGPPEPGKL